MTFGGSSVLVFFLSVFRFVFFFVLHFLRATLLFTRVLLDSCLRFVENKSKLVFVLLLYNNNNDLLQLQHSHKVFVRSFAHATTKIRSRGTDRQVSLFFIFCYLVLTSLSFQIEEMLIGGYWTFNLLTHIWPCLIGRREQLSVVNSLTYCRLGANHLSVWYQLLVGFDVVIYSQDHQVRRYL